MDLPRDPLNVCDIDNLGFFEYLDRDSCLREYMHANLNFTERSFTDGFTKNVLANLPFVWLQIQLSLRYPVHYPLLRL